MNNLLVIVFAALDCKAWDIRHLNSWASDLVLHLDNPKTWLMELSTVGDLRAGLDVVRCAMRQHDVFLPSSVGDLMAGLILLRLDAGQISAESAKKELVDVVDAYEVCNVDIKTVRSIDLNHPIFSELRDIASDSLACLESRNLLKGNHSLLEE